MTFFYYLNDFHNILQNKLILIALRSSYLSVYTLIYKTKTNYDICGIKKNFYKNKSKYSSFGKKIKKLKEIFLTSNNLINIFIYTVFFSYNISMQFPYSKKATSTKKQPEVW